MHLSFRLDNYNTDDFIAEIQILPVFPLVT